MAITFLNGKSLKYAVLAGAKKVIESTDHLNKINVFPVPDGDTGSNMASTFTSISNAVGKIETDDVAKVSADVADSALNGARGNSGAILAQFFQGLAQGFEQHAKIGLEQFSQVVSKTVSATRDAIANPVEGTIITVMQDWAEAIKRYWPDAKDFESLMTKSLEVAKISLAETPKKLKVLSKAHVVDAGAQGFVNFLQGINELIKNHKQGKAYLLEFVKNLQKHDIKVSKIVANTAEIDELDLQLSPAEAHGGDIEFQYCTECILYGELDVAAIRQTLKSWGNSLVAVGSKRKLKIHIHTNAPQRVFNLLENYGELLETKADDMWAQYRANIGIDINREIALMTDSTCSIPQEYLAKYNIITIPLQITINDVAYYDKVNISAEKFYQALDDPQAKVGTSQPTPFDFNQAFSKARHRAKQAVGIFISSKLSGTFDRAKTIAEQQTDFPTYIFDSKSATCALGLIVEFAAEAIHEKKSITEIQQIIETAIANSKLFVAPRTLKNLIQGGRIKPGLGKLLTGFRILPSLGVDEHGHVQKQGVGFGKYLTQRKIIKQALKYAKQFKNPRFLVAEANAVKDAEKLQKALQKAYPKANIHLVPAAYGLMTHIGSGTVAIGVSAID